MSDDGGHYLYRMMRDPADDEAANVSDIGSDVRIMFTVHDDAAPAIGGGLRCGLIVSHRAPDGRECGGSVTFGNAPASLHGPRWQVEQWEPLTISPSIRCDCGWHGFIRDGRWIPA